MTDRQRHPNHRPVESLPVELRRTSVPDHVRAWVARVTGHTVARVDRLAGASSTAVHRLRLVSGVSVVLRRYVWPGFLEDEPIAPQRELDALRFAAAHDAAAPHAIAADIIGHDIGDRIPTILMTLLPGRAIASPDPSRLAEAAAQIHAIDAADFPHRYFPWFEGIFERPPSNARRPHLWERAIKVRAGDAPEYAPVFIHRDFHPGNVLWHRGRITGVVDWANACQGPAGCDVATCRRNLLDWADVDTADAFVAAYEALTGAAVHPYWEIASVLEHGPSPWTPQRIDQSEMQLDRALATLGR